MSLQNLFVAKLPRNICDADLLQIFSEFAPSSAKVMLDAATGRSKGFGFVLFEDEEKGAAAYNALNRKMTRACGHHFTLVIYPSNHDGKIFAEDSNAVYIRNIPMSVGQENVKRFLSTFGKLTYFAMRVDHYGNLVWVVYAEYETVEEARNAVTKLHGNSSYFHGSAPILAKFEDSDDAKRERRRRRDGGRGQVPSGRCVFPPPRERPDSACSLQNSATTLESDMGPSQSGGRSSENVGGSCSSDISSMTRRNGTESHALVMPDAPKLTVSPPVPPATPPPPYSAAVQEARPGVPAGSYPLPSTLLQATSNYCYILAGGQQVLLPSSSFAPPAFPFEFSQFVGPTASVAPPPLNMPVAPPDVALPHGYSMLDSSDNAAAVLMNNGHHYILAPDAVNMNVDFLSPRNATRLLDGEAAQPEGTAALMDMPMTYSNLVGGNLLNVLHTPAEENFFKAAIAAPASAMSSSMVPSTLPNATSSPFVFLPYTAPQ